MKKSSKKSRQDSLWDKLRTEDKRRKDKEELGKEKINLTVAVVVEAMKA